MCILSACVSYAFGCFSNGFCWKILCRILTPFPDAYHRNKHKKPPPPIVNKVAASFLSFCMCSSWPHFDEIHSLQKLQLCLFPLGYKKLWPLGFISGVVFCFFLYVILQDWTPVNPKYDLSKKINKNKKICNMIQHMLFIWIFCFKGHDSFIQQLVAPSLLMSHEWVSDQILL